MGAIFGGGGGAAAPAQTVTQPVAPGTLVQTVLTPGTNNSTLPPVPGETDEQRRQRLAMQQANNILGGGDGGTGPGGNGTSGNGGNGSGAGDGGGDGDGSSSGV